jgi:predicted small secreted protein
LQDTVSSGHDLENEEINYWITATGSAQAAAIMIARSLITKYAKQVDKAVGDLRIFYSQRADAWKDILSQIQQGASALSPATVYAGGISKAEIVTDSQDSDLVQPHFKMDMHALDGNTRNDLLHREDD